MLPLRELEPAAPHASPWRFPAVDEATNRVWARLQKVAPTRLSVLILGETGSGKELAAEWVFQNSGRGTRMLRINCASLSESLVESELFGHEKGAFTGAHAARAGIFEAAAGGTLFLDEVGELPLSTQAKLLRVLESGELVRLGSTTPHRVDVRIIAATHRNLPERVQNGLFREDLFFRLNGVSAILPPLRERVSEILPLAEHFAATVAAALGIVMPSIDPSAREALLRHPWPGNVRELRHVIERGIALCHGDCIQVEHLELTGGPAAISVAPPAPVRAPAAVTTTIRSERHALERHQILAALQQTHGNQTRAAALLGISRRTLTNKLNMHALPRPRKPVE